MHLLLLALACTGDGSSTKNDDSSPPADTDTGEPLDTAPPGTDDDGDGWTVEEGDCDDADIYANPAWDEDTSDDKDNDCDGRIDEVWTGLAVVYADTAGGGSLLQIDTLGNLADEVEIDADCTPLTIDEGLDGGFIIYNYYSGTVATLDEDGGCTDLADFSEAEIPLSDAAAHPDGYTVAATGDALYAISADGGTTELASWSADYTDAASFERYVYAIAVDRVDGTVGLFDYFGGFATWSPADGLTDHLAADLENVELALLSGTARDGGGFTALAQDAATGAYGIQDFEQDTNTWTLLATWEDTTRTPSAITTEGGTQDTYAISNAGQRGRVWRVRREDGSQATLYETDPDPDRFFTAIATTCTED